MVTIAEAQAQVVSAKEELGKARTQSQQREAEIKLAKAESQQRLQRQTKIGTISTQLQIAAQVGRGGVRGEISKRRRVARTEFRERRKRISKAREELGEFRTQLTTREKEIAKVETQIVSAQQQQAKIAEQQAIQADIATAKKLVRRGIFDPFAPPRVKKFVRELQAGQLPLQPTPTEISLMMSLPVGLRELPPTEVAAGIPGARIFARQTIAPVSIQPIDKITFGDPIKFGESFAAATGATSFTLAVPIRREEGRIRVQDFNFQFVDGRVVRAEPTGTALITEEQFLAADLRRRERTPGFTFGTTAQFQSVAPKDFVPTLEVKEGEGLGGVILKRTELEEIRQQSLPLGTTGFIPQEGVREFGFREFVTMGIPPLEETQKGFFEIGGKISGKAEVIGKTLGFPGIADVISKDREQRIKLRQESISLGVKGLGLGVRGAATLIPTTLTGVAVTGGLVAATIFTPPIIGTTIGAGVAGFGIKGVLDTGLTLEERVGSGIVAGLGGLGVVARGIPFIRGIRARTLQEFKPVIIQPEGFKGIKIEEQISPGIIGGIEKGVPEIPVTIGKPIILTRKGIEISGIEFERVGLILPRSPLRTGETIGVELPKTSPLVRGGFGVREFEKPQFLGKEQFLTTSQRGFFEEGIEIPLQRKFFVTPQEPTLRIPETRESRLGLEEPFKFPRAIEIGFGLPKVPQIGITVGEVARVERGGAFAIGRGTELEAIKTTGTITGVERIGRTVIEGQGVDIFRFKIGDGRIGRIKKVSTKEFISTERITRVPGESILSSFIRRPTTGISFPTRPIVSLGVSLGISPPVSPLIFPRVSPPTRPPISPPISPPVSFPISPTAPTLSPFGFVFKDPFKQITRRRRKTAERKLPKRKKKLREGLDIRLAPSFTAIVGELRGIFPKELRIGGISPREIRVIPKRRKKK